MSEMLIISYYCTVLAFEVSGALGADHIRKSMHHLRNLWNEC
jgi:hypothetical protein